MEAAGWLPLNPAERVAWTFMCDGGAGLRPPGTRWGPGQPPGTLALRPGAQGVSFPRTQNRTHWNKGLPGLAASQAGPFRPFPLGAAQLPRNTVTPL